MKRAATRSAYSVEPGSSFGLPRTTIFTVKAIASNATAHAVDFDLIAATDSKGEAVKSFVLPRNMTSS